MPWSKEFTKDYMRKYAIAHRDSSEWKASTRDRQRKRRHKTKQRLVNLLGGKCIRCGFNEHMYALEFDHVDPASKEHEPSYLVSSVSYQRAADYISTHCQLLCANCHVLKSVSYADQSRGRSFSDTSADLDLFLQKP